MAAQLQLPSAPNHDLTPDWAAIGGRPGGRSNERGSYWDHATGRDVDERGQSLPIGTRSPTVRVSPPVASIPTVEPVAITPSPAASIPAAPIPDPRPRLDPLRSILAVLAVVCVLAWILALRAM